MSKSGYRYVGAENKHRGEDGKFVAVGDVIEMTEGQAAAFSDRFESTTDKSEAPQRPAKATKDVK